MLDTARRGGGEGEHQGRPPCPRSCKGTQGEMYCSHKDTEYFGHGGTYRGIRATRPRSSGGRATRRCAPVPVAIVQDGQGEGMHGDNEGEKSRTDASLACPDAGPACTAQGTLGACPSRDHAVLRVKDGPTEEEKEGGPTAEQSYESTGILHAGGRETPAPALTHSSAAEEDSTLAKAASEGGDGGIAKP
ncbi:hypothetical protein H696_05802 [Fonticula alba]|uniref:Uncharacterized protein n=1 Tax=Fonticula alba TaxID=691883 RepID=A0A058Z173_FONAL|nr:hypothetical protein H696_05802 [Fonticula alba]KCV67693.1 hypothetical protein H696_05802 [Fonticula alba]|eukprot:XP_009497877.1 hypothetical protein H696_05802 [Fonticula alba]